MAFDGRFLSFLPKGFAGDSFSESGELFLIMHGIASSLQFEMGDMEVLLSWPRVTLGRRGTTVLPDSSNRLTWLSLGLWGWEPEGIEVE